MKFTTVPIN